VDQGVADEAVSEGCSVNHEWRHDGGEERWRLELGARAKEAVREVGREGKKGR
jgi:hypothetical protein